MTDAAGPVVEVSGQFADELVAREVADTLNRWFRWILDGSNAPVPELFESFGVDTAEYAWSLQDDVDWQVGPHARTIGEEVRVSIQTQDTYRKVAGLLRRLGASSARVIREDD